MKTTLVQSPDGLSLACYETGNPDGPEVLFIHGFSQCSQCWQAQMTDLELQKRFRLVAYDIRGHGASGKPDDPRHYGSDDLFANDTRAVMRRLGLKRPVLAGWSYAGRLIGDYVRAFGTGGIAGINYVCARTNNDPAFKGPGTRFLDAMCGSDAALEAGATRAFVRACFSRMPAPQDLERIIAYNMSVKPHIRRAHLARSASDGAVMASIAVPVLVTQGAEDQLVLKGLADVTVAAVPGARLSLYDGIGHSPFAEDPERFNLELADFVGLCNSG